MKSDALLQNEDGSSIWPLSLQRLAEIVAHARGLRRKAIRLL